MKQFFTNENELSMFIHAFPGYHVPAPFADEVIARISPGPSSPEEALNEIPDPQIVKNILNYARSLEVMKPTTGAALFLINN